MRMQEEGKPAVTDFLRQRRVELEKIFLGTRLSISEVALHDAKFEVVTGWLNRSIDVQLRGYIWGENLKHYEFKAPLNWWEAVKERFAPRWFLKKHPVRYRVEEVDVKALYPKLNISMPEEAHTLKIYKQESF